MNTASSGGSAARIFSGYGPKPMLDKADGAGLAPLMERFDAHHAEVKGLLTDNKNEVQRVSGKVADIQAEVLDLQQKMVRARRGGGLPDNGVSLGHAIAQNQEVKALDSSKRGTLRFSLDTKTINNLGSGTTTVGTGISPDTSLTVADRQPMVALPRRRLVVRNLIAPGITAANAIEYPVQTAFQNSAAPVAEGVLKPQSDMSFDPKSAPVRTIAHFVKASRQILDDAPALASFIDSQLRYGLQIVEEAEILYGDGTGQHLFGLMSQAVPFSAPFAVSSPTPFDTILQAIAQVEVGLYEATGILVNPLDWRRMQAIKDGMGRYLSNGPYNQDQIDRVWQLPLVPTPVMPAGSFMVGAFATAAQLFDRMSIEVLVSTEDGDNLQRNMVTIRAEERVALAVYRPGAIVAGTFP